MYRVGQQVRGAQTAGYSRFGRMIVAATLGASFASVFSGRVQAQTVQLQTIDVQGVPGNADGRDANGINGVVASQSTSATKTNTPLLETPQSISVVTRKQMIEQGADNATQALQYTAGFANNPTAQDSRWDVPLIRGFLAPLYLDGMLLPIGASQFARPRIEVFGTQEIDVLRGAAASALYGQNPPGGLVNYVSARPTDTPTHTIEIRGNTYGNMQGAFDIGGPLDPDGHFLYRLTGVVHDGGTQVKFDNDQREYIAPALTWRPDGNTTLTVLTQYQHDRTGIPSQFLPAVGTLYPNPNGRIPLNLNIGEPDHDFFDRTQYMAGYLFEHHFDNVWTVRQNLRYAAINTDTESANGFFLGPSLGPDLMTMKRLNFSLPESATALTIDNEVEAKVATGPLLHTLLLGIDYRRATSNFREGFASISPINLFDPVYGATLTSPPITVNDGQRQDQLGTYAQDQIKFGRWGLTLSGRHDWVDTTTLNFLAGSAMPRSQQNDSAFSGRAALNYVFDVGVAPYVAYSHSFSPTLGVTVQNGGVKPTTGDEFEAGVKYQPVGTNLLFTAAAYDMNEDNYVTPSTVPGFSIQTGKVNIRGIELEAKASLTEGLDVVASYTLTDAHVVGGNPATAGHRVNQIPDDQAALWANYTFHWGPLSGLGLGGGVRYTGWSYGDLANTLFIPSYTLFDAALQYDIGKLDPAWKGATFAVNADNLFNKYYVSSCQSTSQCFLGNGRLIRISMRYTW